MPSRLANHVSMHEEHLLGTAAEQPLLGDEDKVQSVGL